MATTTLVELLERNAHHVDALDDDHFDAVQDDQRPAAVSVCCSDARVDQLGMWEVDAPGWLFTVATIGNQVWDRVDDRQVVDGSVLYPLLETETRVAVVVGHTGCGAVTAATRSVWGTTTFASPGIEQRVAMLEPVVETAPAWVATPETPEAVDRLAEWNVDRQVAFLRDDDSVPDDVTVLGFVYDLHGTYGGPRGLAALVNVDGERDVEAIRDPLPSAYEGQARRLTTPP